jgi:hypothetical protein
VLALFNVNAYRNQFHEACDEGLANMNGDGAIDFFDVDPFLECLFGGACL